jgi:hypothetical protein
LSSGPHKSHKLRKRLAIGFGALLLLPFVLLGIALIALQFPPIRGFARDKLLAVISSSLQGRVEVDDLRWPSLTHIELSGVRLFDRHGDQVANIGILSTRLDLAPLLAAKVHVTELTADQLFLDLATPGTDHGLLSVFESKEPKPPEPEPESKKGSSIAIQLDKICVEGSEIKAKPQPDLAVSLVRFDSCAMFSMADDMVVRLDRLRGEVRYNQNPTVAFIDEKMLHDWDAQPAEAHGVGRELAKAFLKGTVTIAEPAMAFDGRFELRGVSKRTFEAAKINADVLTGAADLSLAVRGDVSYMTYMLELRAPDSSVKAEGEISPESSAHARISSDGLQLAKFTTISTEPMKFVLNVGADLARKEGPGIKADLQGTYGSWPLPVVKVAAELGKNGAVNVPHFEARYPAAEVLGRARVGQGGAVEASLAAKADLAKVPPLRANLPGWSGQLAMDASFTRAAESGPIAVKSHATLAKLLATEPALSADKLDIRFAANGQADKPTIDANVSLTELDFRDTRVAEAELMATGGPELYQLQGRMDGDRGVLDAWLKMRDGGLEAGGQVKARLPHGKAEASVEHLQLVSGQSLEITRLRLQHLGARAVADGSLGLAGKKSQIKLEARVDDIGALTQELGIKEVPGKLKLAASVTGTLAKPVVDLKLDFKNGPRLAGAQSALSLQARLDAEESKATVNALASAGKANVRAALNSQWRKGAPLSAAADGHHELELNLDRLAIGEVLRQGDTPPPMPIEGTVAANLKVSGNRKEIDLKSEVNAKVVLGKEPELGMKLVTEYGGGGLSLNAEVDDPNGNLLQANWHQATRLESFVDKAPKLPEWFGHTNWEASVQLASRRIAELPSVHTKKMMRDLWPLRAEASIELSHKAGNEPIGDVKVKTAWDPEHVDPSRATCSQRVKPQIEMNGKLRNGLFVTQVNGTSGDKKMLDINAQLGSKLEEWLEGMPLEITKAKILAKLQNFDLAEWPVTCEQAAGALTAEFTASNLFDKSAVFRAKLGGQNIVVGQSVPFDFGMEAQALPSGMDVMARIDRIGGYALIKGSVPISVYVHDPATSVDMNGNLALEVGFNRVDAKSLLQLVPAVARPAGTFDGHIKVYGTLAKPRGTGSIAMKDVSLTLPKLGQRFTKVNGSIGINDNKIQIPELEVKDQGGTAKFRATLELDTSDAFKVDLNAKFDKFPLRKRGVLIGRADAAAKVTVNSRPAQTDVEVRLSGVSVDLSGDTGANVQSLEDHPEISVDGEEKLVEEEQPPEQKAAIINVFVRSDEPLWVRRDDFAVRMQTDLGVHVANGTAQITGEVKLERGYIALLGQQFDVKQGRVTFTGGQTVNPSLELTAESTAPSGTVVRVEVTGFVSAPQLAFFVDDQPADAGLALVALVGRGKGATQESAESQIASAAIGMTTGLLSLGARREFGDFIPMLSIDQGTDDTRIRAGFEADKLIPKFMRGFVRGAYVEGEVSTGESQGQNSTGNAQTGVLLELMLPKDLVWAGKYGPGQTWSLDLDWRP